jgi:uncharacterized protein (DUF305 family)
MFAPTPFPPAAPQIVNVFRRPALTAALVSTALAVSLPATSQAQHNHAGMSEIKIPPGANYTKADVEFMQGMIAHHAQAIYMSRLVEAHGASPRLLRLANKIDQSQVG